MRKIIISIILSVICTSSSFGQWSIIASGTTADLKQIIFPDSLNGFILAQGPGESMILRTIDGGYNWKPILTGNIFGGIDFLNTMTGVVVSKDTIYKTFDGGDTWTRSLTNNCPVRNLFHMNSLNEMIFVNDQHYGHSLDGGLIWVDNVQGLASSLLGEAKQIFWGKLNSSLTWNRIEINLKFSNNSEITFQFRNLSKTRLLINRANINQLVVG